MWRELYGAHGAKNFLLLFSQQICKNVVEFLQMSFFRKAMTSSHFLCFFFHLPFSPKIPEDLERSVRGSLRVYFSPPLVAVKVFTLFLWNLLHVTHSTRTTRDPGKKEGFHYYCASDKEKPQRKKEKRTMKLARSSSPDGARCRFPAEPIGTVYVEEGLTET